MKGDDAGSRGRRRIHLEGADPKWSKRPPPPGAKQAPPTPSVPASPPAGIQHGGLQGEAERQRLETNERETRDRIQRLVGRVSAIERALPSLAEAEVTRAGEAVEDARTSAEGARQSRLQQLDLQHTQERIEAEHLGSDDGR